MINVNVYKESGRLGNSLLLVPIVAGPIIFTLGLVYVYIRVNLPARLIVPYIPIGYGFLSALCIRHMAVQGKCRNSLVVLALGIAGGMLAVDTIWTVYLYSLAPKSANLDFVALCFNPGIVWRAINMRRMPVIWALEAGAIGIFPALYPFLTLKRVFCEEYNKWCDIKVLGCFKDQMDSAQAERLKQGEFAVLAELPVNPNAAYPYLRLNSFSCDKCNNTVACQVIRITGKRTKTGSLAEEELTKQILFTPEQFEESLATKILAASPKVQSGEAETANR